MKKKAAKKKVIKEIVKVEKRFPVESTEIVSNIIVKGDLSGLDQKQRIDYYFSLCKSLKLNPLTKPFDLISLNGKLVMYANSNCAQQLRQNHNISVIDQKTEKIDDIIITTVKVQNGDGRTDTGTGAVNVSGMKGNDLANAIMKSETKAKRRATLSLGGLGMIDETELETVPNVKHVDLDIDTGGKKKEQTQPDIDPSEAERKRADAIAKMESLPENVKEGFKILGYSAKNVFLFCEKFGWDEGRIMKEINRIVDMKNA